MTQEQLNRINELAKKSKTPAGLTDAERAEQKELRDAYIAGFRNNLRAQLDNTYVVTEDGEKRPLQKKTK